MGLFTVVAPAGFEADDVRREERKEPHNFLCGPCMYHRQIDDILRASQLVKCIVGIRFLLLML